MPLPLSGVAFNIALNNIHKTTHHRDHPKRQHVARWSIECNIKRDTRKASKGIPTLSSKCAEKKRKSINNYRVYQIPPSQTTNQPIYKKTNRSDLRVELRNIHRKIRFYHQTQPRPAKIDILANEMGNAQNR